MGRSREREMVEGKKIVGVVQKGGDAIQRDKRGRNGEKKKEKTHLSCDLRQIDLNDLMSVRHSILLTSSRSWCTRCLRDWARKGRWVVDTSVSSRTLDLVVSQTESISRPPPEASQRLPGSPRGGDFSATSRTSKEPNEERATHQVVQHYNSTSNPVPYPDSTRSDLPT